MSPIPKIIHAIWFGPPIPRNLARNLELWQRFNPDWEFRLWVEGDLPGDLPLLDLVWEAEKWYPKDQYRFKADLVRLGLLWLYGGLYTDTDSTPKQPIAPIVALDEFVAARSPQHVRGHHPVANGFMAATPHHPFVWELIWTIPDALQTWGHRSLARSVGPWHVTRTYEGGDWPGVTILGPRELYNSQWLDHSWNTRASRRGKVAT